MSPTRTAQVAALLDMLELRGVPAPLGSAFVKKTLADADLLRAQNQKPKADAGQVLTHTSVGDRSFQRHVRAACKVGQIAGAFKIGSRWHFSREAYEAWLTECRTASRGQQPANDVTEAPAPSAAKPISAADRVRARLNRARG